MKKLSGIPSLLVALIFSRFYCCYFTGVVATLIFLFSHRQSLLSLDAYWHLPESKVGQIIRPLVKSFSKLFLFFTSIIIIGCVSHQQYRGRVVN